MIPNTFKYFRPDELHTDYVNDIHVTSIVSSTFRCLIDESCYFPNDGKKTNIIANCIYMFLCEKPFFNTNCYWLFYYDENNSRNNERDINVYQLYLKYPHTIVGKIDLALLNISKHLGECSKTITSSFIENHYRDFLPETRLIDYHTMVNFLIQRGYMLNYTLTFEGWNRIDELQDKLKTYNQVFIASQFNGFDNIIDVVKKTIIENGYSPIYMKDHQTNNYIMPEIFSLIDDSKAVVGEISSKNNGVYFEIGYAKGRRKDIILICKSEYDKNGKLITGGHFDVSQVSTIYYDNEEDLEKKLSFRIKNTLSKS